MTLPVSCLTRTTYFNALCGVDSSTKSYGDFKFSSRCSPVIIRCKLTKGDYSVIDASVSAVQFDKLDLSRQAS